MREERKESKHLFQFTSPLLSSEDHSQPHKPSEREEGLLSRHLRWHQPLWTTGDSTQ